MKLDNKLCREVYNRYGVNITGYVQDPYTLEVISTSTIFLLGTDGDKIVELVCRGGRLVGEVYANMHDYIYNCQNEELRGKLCRCNKKIKNWFHVDTLCCPIHSDTIIYQVKNIP